MLGLGSASQNSLRALRPLRSNSCDESVHNARKRARPQAEHRSRHRNEPLPGTACREEMWWACDRRAPTMSLQRRVRAGRGASLRGAWVCLVSWRRACALRELTRRTCLSAAALGRVASCATRHEIKQTQGSRCEAPTALPMRRGLPGHDFAACLCLSLTRSGIHASKWITRQHGLRVKPAMTAAQKRGVFPLRQSFDRMPCFFSSVCTWDRFRS